jgi:hypothetical protein
MCSAAAACVLISTGEGEVPLEWNSGSNGYVYWVSSYLGGPLTQLPHVTPAQVHSSNSSSSSSSSIVQYAYTAGYWHAGMITPCVGLALQQQCAWLLCYGKHLDRSAQQSVRVLHLTLNKQQVPEWARHCHVAACLFMCGVQIKAARSLKRLLSGRLSSPVSSYPVFPGNEANFLRAQVGAAARETATSSSSGQGCDKPRMLQAAAQK